MAVHPSATTTDSTTTRVVDLRANYGLDVPAGAARVAIDVDGDASSFVVRVRRRHTWIVEGALHSAEVTAVYDDGRAIRQPERVPDWLALVLRDLDAVRIDQVSI